MSTKPRRAGRELPLVALVCAIPLVAEAVRSELGFAEVIMLADRGGDIGGLLHWLHPDAVVVDTDEAAVGAAAYAQEHELPVVHISPRKKALYVFQGGAWQETGNGEGPTPENVRNVIVGALYTGGGAVA
jgi:hypothetical protein